MGVVAFAAFTFCSFAPAMDFAQPLAEIIHTADVIAVATLRKQDVPSHYSHGARVRMSFTTVLHGPLTSGMHTLFCPDLPIVGGTRRLPLFRVVDKDDTMLVFATGDETNLQWFAAAHKYLGKSVEDGLLRVDTFSACYHRVLPDLLTLKQVKAFQQTGNLRFRLVGTLASGNSDGKHNGEPQLHLEYDAIMQRSRLTGLPEAFGHVDDPFIRFEYGKLVIYFGSVGSKPQAIHGEVVAFHPDTQVIEARFKAAQETEGSRSNQAKQAEAAPTEK